MILINGEPQQRRARVAQRSAPVAAKQPTRAPNRAEIARALIQRIDSTGWGGRWKGATVVCIASGPSVTAEDVERVRQWREACAGRHVIVVNTTYQAAPWADAVFAMDRAWWRRYGKDESMTAFAGERVSTERVKGVAPGVQYPKFKNFGNSGTGAVALAALAGASRIILLGYDCQRGPNGEVHHHGDHPKGLGNALSMPKWFKFFESCAASLRGHNIINCSRATALTCWPRADLEAVL